MKKIIAKSMYTLKKTSSQPKKNLYLTVSFG